MYPLAPSAEDDSAADLRGRAMARLGAAEAPFARLIDIYGAADPFVFHDGGRTTGNLFAALSLHIISQRIQAMVGFRIYDRVAALTGGAPTAATVLEAGRGRLASCGLPGAEVHHMLAFGARGGL